MPRALACCVVLLATACASPPPPPAAPAAASAAQVATSGLPRCPPPPPVAPSASDGAAALGLSVADGFRVEEVAGSDAVNDVHALTFDREGRLLVSSPGGVRSLGCPGRLTAPTEVLPTPTGAMGMADDRDGIYLVTDGALAFVPRTADKLDGAHRVSLLDIHHGEHGGHHILQGPDGDYLAIVGNEERVKPPIVDPLRSPILKARAGFLMRWPARQPNRDRLQVLAEGLRNPYRFDVTADGDVLTFDSDGEREVSLPWYTPTRVVHVDTAGGNHGWVPQGWTRSWSLPTAYPDRADVVFFAGRSSPTGVVVYRHPLFPRRYRDGVFIEDWTFGRILFVPLSREGAGLRAGTPEVLLQSVGTEGFAPSDMTVGPDGALWVSIGGRRTRGAIFRIVPRRSADASVTVTMPVERVLRAPQPLSAWSRGRWEPLADELGVLAFSAAARDVDRPVGERLRAIEVCVDRFGGVPADALAALVAASEPRVRARTLWAIGRGRSALMAPEGAALIAGARDAEPLVRQRALEAIGDRLGELAAKDVAEAAAENVGHADRRVRSTAIVLASRLDAAALEGLADRTKPLSTRAGALVARAVAHRRRGIPLGALTDEALALLPEVRRPGELVDVLRLITLGLGDLAVLKPPAEVFSLYALAAPAPPEVRARVLAAVRPLRSEDPVALDELVRLFALLEDDSPATRDCLVAMLGPKRSAEGNVHVLVSLARLRTTFSPQQSQHIARTLLGLRDQLGAEAERNLANWDLHLADAVRALLPHAPALPAALAANPAITRPAHLPLVALLPEAQRRTVARALLAAARKKPDAPLPDAAVALFALLPRAEVAPLLRAHWAELGLRDQLVTLLSDVPTPADRPHFLAALRSSPAVAAKSLAALERLPKPSAQERTDELRALLALHGRLDRPADAALRGQVRARMLALVGADGPAVGASDDKEALRAAHRGLQDWVVAKVPALTATEEGAPLSPEAWVARARTIAWSRGDAGRGERIFRERACGNCHAGATPLGPSLLGVGSRMSREDLLLAIVDPSRDVSLLYQPTVIETRTGQTYTGLVTYAAEVILLRTDPTTLQRVAVGDMVARRPGDASMMPEGLLEGLSDEAVADLFAHLATLR